MKIIKIILSLIATSIPSEIIRKLLLNSIPGFTINKDCKIGLFNLFNLNEFNAINSKIGNFNLFKSQKLTILNSKIGNFNKLLNFKEIILIKKSIIGSNNFIKEKSKYNKKIFMKRAQISYKKKIFLNGGLYLGSNVVFGGIGTKIIQSDILSKTIFFGDTWNSNANYRCKLDG